MLFKDVSQTYVCQFSKPQNKAILESYKVRQDKSGAELARYYTDILSMLQGTPAWGVSGVNKMINELTTAVRATIAKAKSGKTSAPAHAAKMLRYVNYYGNQTAEARYNGNHKLIALATEEELSILAAAD